LKIRHGPPPNWVQPSAKMRFVPECTKRNVGRGVTTAMIHLGTSHRSVWIECAWDNRGPKMVTLRHLAPAGSP
jgi:hypothetical protein